MRVLIACDKFKGSLNAAAACEAVRNGLTSRWQSELYPIADGGEGFVAAMLAGRGGERVTVACLDLLGRGIAAEYGLCRLGSRTLAFVEVAAASGLHLAAEAERDLRHSSSFGSGQLIRHAAEISHATTIIVGLGGSGTNDGGAGIAQALGVRFLDKSGAVLPCHPEGLSRLAAVDESGRMALPEIQVACDVDNPLTGPRGASAVFGPQKGASPVDVIQLDERLALLAEIAGAGDIAALPGAGAAGGMGFGLVRFAGARLKPGFAVVAEALGLRERLAQADLVITGEGSLDEQSLGGKGPCGIAAMAREAGVPVVAIAGRVRGAVHGEFDAVLSLEKLGLPAEETMRRAAECVSTLVMNHAGLLERLASR